MELEHLGWNVLTFGFIGTLVFALVEMWGLWEQSKEIRVKRSGQSLSVTWIVYGVALMTAAGIYGLSKVSIALIAGGFLVALMHLPIIAGLLKYKGFAKREWALAVFLALGLVVMAFAPRKDIFFLLFSFGSIGSSVMQPYEIWRDKNAGVVAIKLVLAFLASTVFWTTYAFAIGDWVLMIICPAYLVILTATLCLWAKYRKPEPLTAAICQQGGVG